MKSLHELGSEHYLTYLDELPNEKLPEHGHTIVNDANDDVVVVVGVNDEGVGNVKGGMDNSNSIEIEMKNVKANEENLVEIPMTRREIVKDYFFHYFRKLAAKDWPERKTPPPHNYQHLFLSWLMSFCGILIITILNEYANQTILGTDHKRAVYSIAPYGANAVLIFQAVQSPLAQPRNAFFGNLIGGFFGVTAWKIMQVDDMDARVSVAAALAVSLTIFFQQLFNVVHPPGGAIALAAVLSGPAVRELGYWYLIFPVTIATSIMLIVALIMNNIPPSRRYPLWW